MRRALVTGHRGFVGRHMFRALAKAGYNVTGVDKAGGRPLGYGHEHNWTDVQRYFRRKNFNDFHYSLVVHCAAIAPHRMAIDKEPAVVGSRNMSIDADLFRWALKAKPTRIVYLSSSAAYPVSLQSDPATARPLREEDIDFQADEVGRPDAIYGWLKLSGEILCNMAREAGLGVTVVRPFSGYGEDQDERFPFGAFINRAKSRKDPFAIWGDGQQVRDWIHIDDVVGGILAAVDAGFDGPLNLGTGRPVSLNELAALVTREAEYTPRFERVLSAPAGVAYRVADIRNMAEIYTPRVSLEEGVIRALA